MPKKIDYTNKQVGRLKVLYKEDKKDNAGHYLWKCECECGNFCSISSCNLSSNNSKSCGCKRIADKRLHSNWKGCGDISGRYFKDLKHGAERRNIPFNITIEEIWDKFQKQNARCALTGLEIKFCTTSTTKDQTASLDRIDPNKEYCIDNVQWVHKNINNLKMGFTETELLYWCKLLIEYNKENCY